jgi:Asp-tRNA(Asn)/Glu-tRNA(Gln) amidotransferase B subunit
MVEVVKGKEEMRSKEVEIKNIHSLLTIQREMGIEYLRDRHLYCLSFRDVENLLIKFKNIQKWITFDIIK